jgi:very-short-patch-repair endonuclease
MFEGEFVALDVAASQYGVITKQQALDAGMTERQVDHRVAERRWLIVHPGVYRVSGAPMSARQRAMAACLWLGDDAAVSHTTAARLLRFDGLPKKTLLHLSVPLDRRRSAVKPRPFVLHRVAQLEGQDRVDVDGIRCTSPTRTLLDLAAVLYEEQLEIAFESARRLGLVSVDGIAARFTQVAGRGKKGSAKVRRLLEHQHVGTRPLESPLEVKLWRLLRDSHLPMPERQVTLAAPSGAIYRVDFLWREHRVVVECDGFEAHAGHLRWKRDRRRLADIELLGHRVTHVTWDDVARRPGDTVRRITLALSPNIVT